MSKSRIKNLAQHFQEDLNSDMEQLIDRRSKFMIMGGSWFDSGCHLFCTIVSAAAFCFLAFHQMTAYRTEYGLNKCYIEDGLEQPLTLSSEEIEDGDSMDVSYHWTLLFYANIGSSALAII